MARLLHILQSEKAPYLLAIFFASLGWVLVHTVTEVTTSPLIQFTKEIERGEGHSTVSVDIRNLTRHVSFTNLQLVLLLPQGSNNTFVASRVIPSEPAYDGEQAPTHEGSSATFIIPALEPNGELRLVAEFSGHETPVLQLRKSDQPVRLVRPSLETCFVRHEFALTFGIIAAWALATLLVLAVNTRPAARQMVNGDL